MYLQRTKCIFVGVVWFVGNFSIAGAKPAIENADELANQVSLARTDVDALAERLESQRRTTREELSALRAERAELKRRIRLEQIRRDTLTELIQERTRQVDAQEGRLLTLLAPIKRSVVAAKAYVMATMPFMREERLRRLNTIEADLSVTHPDLGRCLTRLWRFVEEEEAMAREISLDQQVIELEGQRLLADVVRIGMALMYFRLPTGTLGHVVQSKDTWRFERVDSINPRRTIAKIFDDLEKNQVLGPKRLLISTELPRGLNRVVK